MLIYAQQSKLSPVGCMMLYIFYMEWKSTVEGDSVLVLVRGKWKKGIGVCTVPVKTKKKLNAQQRSSILPQCEFFCKARENFPFSPQFFPCTRKRGDDMNEKKGNEEEEKLYSESEFQYHH